MNKTINIATGLAIACLLVTQTPVVANPPLEQQVDAVVSHLVGVMDTSAQASANPDASNVRITTCKIEIEGTEAVFLYQEQALNQSLNQPYRQRFLRIAPSNNGNSIESKSFKLSNPEALVGLCNQPKDQRVVETNALGEAVCSVFLMPLSDIYIGTTQRGGCPANVRGATKITNTIILHSQGMDTWDRGFDADGHQVWGAENESYQYRWLDN